MYSVPLGSYFKCLTFWLVLSIKNSALIFSLINGVVLVPVLMLSGYGGFERFRTEILEVQRQRKNWVSRVSICDTYKSCLLTTEVQSHEFIFYHAAPSQPR
jgi:hypothetical protein